MTQKERAVQRRRVKKLGRRRIRQARIRRKMNRDPYYSTPCEIRLRAGWREPVAPRAISLGDLK